MIEEILSSKDCEEQGHPRSEPIAMGETQAILYCPLCDYLFSKKMIDELKTARSQKKDLTPDEFDEVVEEMSIGDSANRYFYIPDDFRGQKLTIPCKYSGKRPIPAKVFVKHPVEDFCKITLDIPRFAHYVGVREHMLTLNDPLKPAHILEYYDSKGNYGSRERFYNLIPTSALFKELEKIFGRPGTGFMPRTDFIPQINF